MFRRRRPLMRAAMVGGTAYYAGKRMQQGSTRESDQEMRLEQLEAQQAQPQYAAPPVAAPPPPPAPASSGPDMIEQLRQLGELHTQGILTDEEFNAQKAKILASS